MNKETYLELLSVRNSQRVKFHDLSDAVLSLPTATGTAVESFDTAFDIENATGVQLDIIGALVGATRLLNYAPATGDRLMDDDEFRVVIRLTIAKNGWDGTFGSIQETYDEIFSKSVTFSYTDGQDMSLVIDVYGAIGTREIEILENSGLLLMPVGVSHTVRISSEKVDVNMGAAVGISGIQLCEFVTAS